MPCSKKTTVVGSVIAVLSKGLRPYQQVIYKYPNRIPNHHLEKCLVICSPSQHIRYNYPNKILTHHLDKFLVICRQMVISILVIKLLPFFYNYHPNVEIYAVNGCTNNVTSCPDTGFFKEEGNLVTVNPTQLEANQT